jgi:D-alanyl-D-alanine carboxypeptidase
MRHLVTYSLLVMSLLLMNVPVQAATPRYTLDKTTIQKRLEQALTDGLIGVSLAISTPTDGLILATAGVSDRKTKTNLTPTDFSRIASCSKVWVGVAILQLVDEGKLKLSDPIGIYLHPQNVQQIANANSATVQQILTHTSGIPDYYNKPGFGVDVPTKMDFTIDEALRYIWGDPADFAPGAQFEYSNSNTLLLAQAIETITGKPYATVLRTRIFDPLGLNHTFIEVFEPLPRKIVRGYDFFNDEAGQEVGDKYQGGGLPDGGVVTSPADMVKFMQGLFVDGKLLRPETLALLVTPTVKAEENIQMGLHIFINPTRDGVRYEHDGLIDGYLAIQMHYPDTKISVALWTNSGGAAQELSFENLEKDVLRLIFAK